MIWLEELMNAADDINEEQNSLYAGVDALTVSPFQLNSFQACNACNLIYPHCVTDLLGLVVSYGIQVAFCFWSTTPFPCRGSEYPARAVAS